MIFQYYLNLNLRRLLPLFQGVNLLLILVLMGQGCASIRDGKQNVPLVCNTPKCEITYEGKKVVGPAIVELDRSLDKKLVLSYQGQKKKIELQTKARWSDSIFPNLLMGIFSPQLAILGFSVDLISGSMWEFEKPTIIAFKDAPKDIPVLEIAIMPVFASNQFESEVAELKIFEELKLKYPKAKIKTSGFYDIDLERNGWTYEHKPDQYWKRLSVFKKVKTPFVVFGSVERTDRTLKIDYVLKDILRDQIREEKQLIAKIGEGESEMAHNAKSFFINLVPNAIGVQASEIHVNGGYSSDYLSENNEDSAATYARNFSYSPSTDANGSKSEVGFKITNINPDMGRRFSFVSRLAVETTLRNSNFYLVQSNSGWSPSETGGSSYSEEEFPVAYFENYSLATGIGPELGLEGPLGYLFTSMLIGPEFIFSKYKTSERSGNFSDLTYTLGLNLGYKVNFFESYEFGIIGGMNVYPDQFGEKLINKVNVPRNEEGNYYSEGKVSLVLSYYFPTGRKFIKKNLSKVAQL